MAPAGEAEPGTTLLVVQVELPAFNLLSHANFRVRISDYEELHEGALDMLQALADSFEERLVGLELQDGKLGLEKMKTRACAALEELEREVKLVDEWKIKVDRAANHMNKMRDAYYKELSHLREQVYQKRKADEQNVTFHPVYALHFDPADYTLDDEVAKLVQEKVQLLQQEFQTKIVDMEAKHAEQVETLNNKIATTNILLTQKQALLNKVMTTQAPSMESEKAAAKHFRFGTLKEAKEYLGASRNLDDGLSIAELRALTEEFGNDAAGRAGAAASDDEDALSYEQAFCKTTRRSRAVQSQIDGRMLDKAMDFYDDVAEKNWNALVDLMKDDPEEAPVMRGIAPALLEAFVQKSEVREIPAAERSRLCSMRATQTMSVTDLHAVEEVLASREPAGHVAAARGSRLKRRVTFPPQRDHALQGRLDSLAAELTSLPTKALGERFSLELQELAPGIGRLCSGSTREQAGGSSSSSAPPPDAPPHQAPNVQPHSLTGLSYCHRGTSPVQDPRELVLPNLLQAPRVPASTTEFGVQCCLASARRVILPAEDEPHETQMEQVEHVVGVAHELHETLAVVKLRAEKLVAQAIPGSRTEQLLRQLQRVDVVLGGHPFNPGEKSGNAGVLDAQTPGMRSPASDLERNGAPQDPVSCSRRQASPGRRLSEEIGQLRRKDGRRHTSAGAPRPQSQQGNVHYYYGLVRAAPVAHREGSFTMTRNREESLGVSEVSVQEEEEVAQQEEEEQGEEEQGEEEQEVEAEVISRSPKKRKSLTARRPKVVNTPQLIIDRARRRALLAKDQATELVEEAQNDLATLAIHSFRKDANGQTQADARQSERVPTVPPRQALSEAEREEHPQDGKHAEHQEEDGKDGEVEDGRRLIVHEACPLPPLDDDYVDANIEELTVGDDLPVPRGPSPRMTGSSKTTVPEQELPEIPTLAAERPGSRRHCCSDSVADGKISPSSSGPRRRCAPVSAKLPPKGTASSSEIVATPVSGRFQAFDFEDLPFVPSRPDHSPPAQSPPARRESRIKPFRRSVEVAPQEEPQSPRASLVGRPSLRNSVGSQGSMILEEDQRPGERSWSPRLRTSTRARVTTSRAHALLARAGSMRAAGREQFEP